MIALRTLGRIDLEDAAGQRFDRVVVQPRRLALLTYLTVHTPYGFQPRDKLVGLFWPQWDNEHAGRALRQSLHVLRRELGNGVLVSRGDAEVGIDRYAVWCDVCAFRQAVEAGELEKAQDLYAGPFRAGVVLNEAPAFERWAEAERNRLGREYGGVLRTLATRADAAGDWMGAVKWWRVLLEHEPYSSEVVCDTMRALERAGDRSEALRCAEAHALRILADFRAAPHTAVVQLSQRIRRRPASKAASRLGRPSGARLA